MRCLNGIEPKTESKPQPKADESNDFSDGQHALLTAKGYESDAEVALVKEHMDGTGKSLIETLKSKFFLAEVKDVKEAETVKKATPSGNKRSSNTAKDRVSYWLNKPFSEVPSDMKREVVNARIKREKNTGQFTDAPVAGDKM